jgi:hypothetical protein
MPWSRRGRRVGLQREECITLGLLAACALHSTQRPLREATIRTRGAQDRRTVRKEQTVCTHRLLSSRSTPLAASVLARGPWACLPRRRAQMAGGVLCSLRASEQKYPRRDRLPVPLQSHLKLNPPLARCPCSFPRSQFPTSSLSSCHRPLFQLDLLSITPAVQPLSRTTVAGTHFYGAATPLPDPRACPFTSLSTPLAAPRAALLSLEEAPSPSPSPIK